MWTFVGATQQGTADQDFYVKDTRTYMLKTHLLMVLEQDSQGCSLRPLSLLVHGNQLPMYCNVSVSSLGVCALISHKDTRHLGLETLC